MLAKLLKPQADVASLLLRWALAALFTVHGAIKLVQDYPLIPTMSMTMQTVVGVAELTCGVALALGLLSRLAALGMIVVQAGAIMLETWKYALQGPTIEPSGADFSKVGPEFNAVLITMCACVMVLGSGVVSLDHFLMKWWSGRKTGAAAPAGTGRMPQPV
jgi:uncharacterized membrane protein YphA (DoxX/SURF4 family)